jgi:metal-responsive CopG/Arc/MetJ family transcriptional regulator
VINIRIDAKLLELLEKYYREYSADKSKVFKKALIEFLDKKNVK